MEPVVDGISFTVEPGRRVALVGPSGSGKSTVGRLVCGLWRPWSGAVLIDGCEPEDIPPGCRPSLVGYVDQQVFLFAGSVRDNLTLWDASYPEEALRRALEDAALFDELAGRGGLDAEVHEGGANLSGGQRQRLELARALVADPALLVLDEATSALDPLSEAAIGDALRRRGCACLIIAHRLSAVRDCDEILLLDRGRIVERGSHDDLMAQGGRYAALVGAEA